MIKKGLFKNPKNKLEGGTENKQVCLPDEICRKCEQCGTTLLLADLKENLNVCGQCGFHFPLSARERIAATVDQGSFCEFFNGLTSKNILDFPEYDKKLSAAREKSGEEESVVCGRANICGMPVCLFVMEGQFMMGSMGSVCGEKITLLFEYAQRRNMPVIGFTVSGGARMQEGIISLMQMAKTSGAVRRHGSQGGLYVTVLTNPTTGGVTASFAMQGDIIISEPGALICFAGPRVIEQTIKQKLPEGFQRAEFLLEKGFIDSIVQRKDLKTFLCRILRLHGVKNRMKAFDKVNIARHKDRHTASEYIGNIFAEFTPLHGDRRFGDDGAVLGGIAFLNGMPATVIGIEKGRNLQERMKKNFGSANPEGYRKALRLFKQAEKFGRPVICFIDTPGAFPGIGAEERGQGEAIAENIYEMMGLKVPSVSIIIGEGGSGGALALAATDQVWMLENSIYSVISPEGCASILWKDSKRVKEASECLKLTAQDLLSFGVIEKIFNENKDFAELCENIKSELISVINENKAIDINLLLENRYQKFRKIGRISI